VIAVDRYAGAPAMQVADVAEVIAMTDPEALKAVVRQHRPDVVIPEIEALAVGALADLEGEGLTVIPTARATAVTMNRDRIRDLAAGELGLRTARYAYASSAEELAAAAAPLGWPVVVKPVMSSSGKGQSVVEGPAAINAAWEAAMAGARGSGARVIVEEFLRFEQEITLLTVKQWAGPTLFCPPIGHIQERGDYQCSWQPAHLDWDQLAAAQTMARDRQPGRCRPVRRGILCLRHGHWRQRGGVFRAVAQAPRHGAGDPGGAEPQRIRAASARGAGAADSRNPLHGPRRQPRDPGGARQ
jgi:phosphoribosylglycinamide formyltransferase 2